MLCAIGNDGIDFEMLSRTQRPSRALKKALEIMGVHTENVRILPHQTRHAAATDLMMTTPDNATRTRKQVSDFLAHGDNSGDTTLRYTHRYTAEETWSKRVALTEADDKFSNLVAQTNPNRKRQRPPGEEAGGIGHSSMARGGKEHLEVRMQRDQAQASASVALNSKKIPRSVDTRRFELVAGQIAWHQSTRNPKKMVASL